MASQQPNLASDIELSSIPSVSTTTPDAPVSSISSMSGNPSLKRIVTNSNKNRPVLLQAVRFVTFVVYFSTAIFTINFTQFLGLPLRLISKDWFHAYVDYTKQSFSLVLTSMTQWWSPTPVHVVGDRSVAGLLVRNSDGTLETKFGDRIILMANHQIYADWIYLWWTAYATRTHGGIYIILKDSLKNIPFLGWGMQYYNFIFLSRKWEKDKVPLKKSLTKINQESDWPAWLIVFPEGTNITQNGVDKSHAYATKFGFQEPRHLLLPRARGLYFMLKNVNVPYLYDCTIAYEGVPRGGFGQDYFTLSSLYLQGRAMKSVNMHFRRFARSSIPLDDETEFERWLQKRWLEKDELMESYYVNGHFDGEELVDTEIRLRSKKEILQLYAVPAAFLLCANVAWKTWSLFR